MPKNDDKQGKYYGECSHQEQIFIVYVIVTPSCKRLKGPYVNGWKVEIRDCYGITKGVSVHAKQLITSLHHLPSPLQCLSLGHPDKFQSVAPT